MQDSKCKWSEVFVVKRKWRRLVKRFNSTNQRIRTFSSLQSYSITLCTKEDKWTSHTRSLGSPSSQTMHTINGPRTFNNMFKHNLIFSLNISFEIIHNFQTTFKLKIFTVLFHSWLMSIWATNNVSWVSKFTSKSANLIVRFLDWSYNIFFFFLQPFNWA